MKKKISYIIIALFTLAVVMPSVCAVTVNVYGIRSANGTDFEENDTQLAADPLKCKMKFYTNNTFGTEVNYSTNSDYTKVSDYHITLTNVTSSNNIYYVGFDCGPGKALIGLHAGSGVLSGFTKNSNVGTEYRYTMTLPVTAQNVYPKKGTSDIQMTEVQFTSPGCECKKSDGTKVKNEAIEIEVYDDAGNLIDADEATVGSTLVLIVPNEECCPYKENSLYVASNSSCRKYLQRVGRNPENDQCNEVDLGLINPTTDGMVYREGQGITLDSSTPITSNPLKFNFDITESVYDSAVEGLAINAQWDYDTACDGVTPPTPTPTPEEKEAEVPSTGSTYSMVGVGIALVLVTTIGFVVFRKSEN